MLWKCGSQHDSKFGKQQWPQDWKRSVFIPIPEKGNDKECSNYYTIGLISHASKVMLKILQARLQQYVNCELPDVQAGFRKGRGSRDQIASIRWIIKKSKGVPEKHLFLLCWLCQSLWLCEILRMVIYGREILWLSKMFLSIAASAEQTTKFSWSKQFRKQIALNSTGHGEAFISGQLRC